MAVGGPPASIGIYIYIYIYLILGGIYPIGMYIYVYICYTRGDLSVRPIFEPVYEPPAARTPRV